MAFDSNSNHLLDAGDAAFSSFGVWQDLNSDGRTDDGEFYTLGELGIVSLSLVSDNQPSAVASGDVLIHGQTLFTYADGSQGVAQDVEFVGALAYDALQPLVEPSLPSNEVSPLQSLPASVADIDSTSDGLLTSADASFSGFSLWNDHNADGIVDSTELVALHDSQVQSLDLSGGALVASASDGYFHLDGAASVTYDDGSVAYIQDMHIAGLIDHVLSDPSLLDPTASQVSDLSLDPTDLGSIDLGLAVDTFLATEPVTDMQLADLSHDVQLSSDPVSTDVSTTSDPTHVDAVTTIDSSVFDPTHDATVYDPTHDTTVYDPTADTSYHPPV